jgi:hypothetical protein
MVGSPIVSYRPLQARFYREETAIRGRAGPSLAAASRDARFAVFEGQAAAGDL